MSNAKIAVGYTIESATMIHQKDELPAVLVVPEMEQDQLDRLQAAQFMGRIATQSTAEVNKALVDAEPHTTLLEAIKEGNWDLVRANVETNMIEIAFKAGFVMDVTLAEDEHGHTHQHGQSTKSVQANNLLHGVTNGPMYERSAAETRNTFRFETVKQQGLLKDNWYVVFSRTATDMTLEELDEARFFTDTMSLSIQASTEQDVATEESAEIIMESAFMAGVLEPGADRRDEDIIGAIGDVLGVNLRGLSATELLDTPLLIPKSRMPNGTIDLVAMGDRPFDTFFGQKKPTQDYVAYREACREHREMFASKVDRVTKQLMQAADAINNEVISMQRLHELCGDEMVQQAIVDEWIDPSVFGAESAGHIMEGRARYAEGDYEAVLESTRRAMETADPRSCPWLPNPSRGDNSGSDDGECRFVSKKCPECKAENVATTISKRVKKGGGTETRIEGSCGCKVSR